MSFSTCRSVGESSTINILRISMFLPCSFIPANSRAGAARTDILQAPLASSGGGTVDVRSHGLEEAFFGKRLGEVLVGSHHPAAGPIEEAILRRQHDHRGPLEFLVLLDERAGLVTVEARH